MYQILFFITEYKYKFGIFIGIFLLIFCFGYLIINNSKINIETIVNENNIDLKGNITSYFGIKDYKIIVKNINGVKIYSENNKLKDIDFSKFNETNISSSLCETKKCNIDLTINHQTLFDNYYKNVFLNSLEIIESFNKTKNDFQQEGFCHYFPESDICKNFKYSFSSIEIEILYNENYLGENKKSILIKQ